MSVVSINVSRIALKNEDMPTKPHRIRLSGPWELLLTESPRETGQPKRSHQLPFKWNSTEGCESHATLSRKFHCPTGLNEQSRVLIVVECNFEPQIFLNGQSLSLIATPEMGIETASMIQRFEFDVFRLLRPFNELSVSPARVSEGQLATLNSASLEICELH